MNHRNFHIYRAAGMNESSQIVFGLCMAAIATEDPTAVYFDTFEIQRYVPRQSSYHWWFNVMEPEGEHELHRLTVSIARGCIEWVRGGNCYICVPAIPETVRLLLK